MYRQQKHACVSNFLQPVLERDADGAQRDARHQKADQRRQPECPHAKTADEGGGKNEAHHGILLQQRIPDRSAYTALLRLAGAVIPGLGSYHWVIGIRGNVLDPEAILDGLVHSPAVQRATFAS